jgi:hypothetical protein
LKTSAQLFINLVEKHPLVRKLLQIISIVVLKTACLKAGVFTQFTDNKSPISSLLASLAGV